MFTMRKLEWMCAFLSFLLAVSGFREHLIRVQVVEEQRPGVLVTNLSLEPKSTYRISASQEARSLFDIDLQTGAIRTSQTIDREALESDVQRITLIDTDNVNIIVVEVAVLDLNDNAPRFPVASKEITILETAQPGTRLALPSATDPDAAENGTVVNYELGEVSTRFKIQTTGDAVYLELSDYLDRELTDFYSVEVVASDGGVHQRTGQMLVNVVVLDANDNSPVFTEGTYEMELGSLVPGAVIGKVSASDRDAGENGQVSYRIQSNFNGYFSISSKTGDVLLKVCHNLLSVLTGLQDSDANCTVPCLLSVEAYDGGQPQLFSRAFVKILKKTAPLKTLNMRIKTFPPSFPYSAVPEDSKHGTTVAAITVTSSESTKSVAFFNITSGNDGNWFFIENGGIFGILRVNDFSRLNGEKEFNLVITTTMGDEQTTGHVKVLLQKADDQPPALSNTNFTVQMDDTLPLFAEVYQFKTMKREVNLMYTWTTPTNDFILDDVTGAIYTNTTSYQPEYDLQVKVSNPMPSTLHSTAFVKVLVRRSPKESKLEKDEFVFEVYENHTTLDPIGVIRTSHTDGPRKANPFEIMEESMRKVFRIEANGDLVLKTPLDYEQRRMYIMTMVLGGSNNQVPNEGSVTKVVVKVLDVNDNTPYFPETTAHLTLPVNTKTPAEVYTFRGHDLDKADDQQLEYVMLDGSFGDFDLRSDSSVGVLVVSGFRTRNVGETTMLNIGAIDSAGHVSSNNLTIVLHWSAPSVKSPLNQEVQVFGVEENEYPGSLSFNYNVLDGNDFVRVDSVGRIFTLRKFDHEIVNEVTFVVLISDAHVTVTQRCLLIVLDVNDRPPSFVEAYEQPFVVDVMHTPLLSPIGRLMSTDPDTNSTTIYSSSSDLLVVEKTSGLLYLNNTLQDLDEITATVTIEDGDNAALKKSKVVHVLRRNQIKPLKMPRKEYVSVSASTPVGFMVVDLNKRNSTRLEFKKVTKSDFFVLSSNGKLRVRRSLEERVEHILNVQVKDTLRSEVKTMEINIFVKESTEMGLSCPEKPIDIDLRDRVINDVVGKLHVKHGSGLVKYDLHQPFRLHFEVDQRSGHLRLLKMPNTTKLSFTARNWRNETEFVECRAVVLLPHKALKSRFLFEKVANFRNVSFGFDWKTDVIKLPRLLNIGNIPVNFSILNRQNLFKINAGAITLLSEPELDTMYNITVLARSKENCEEYATTILFLNFESRTEPPKLISSSVIEMSEKTETGHTITNLEFENVNEELFLELVGENDQFQLIGTELRIHTEEIIVNDALKKGELAAKLFVIDLDGNGLKTEIMHQFPADYFKLNGLDLEAASDVDFAEDREVLVIVKACNPSDLCTTKPIPIKYHNVRNDFDDDSRTSRIFTLECPENATFGSTIGTLHFSGLIDGRNVTLKSAGNDGNPRFPFSVDGVSGDVKVDGVLDYEAVSYAREFNGHIMQSQVHFSVITVTSAGRTVDLALVVVVTDVGDNAPQFPHNPNVFRIAEHAKHGSVVGQVMPNNRYDNLTFEVTSKLFPRIHGLFRIDQFGTVWTTAPLDKEEHSFYRFEVTVVDGADHKDTTTVIVYVDDVNDNAAKFVNGAEDGPVVVAEDTLIGSPIYTFVVEDMDILRNHNFVISPESDPFQVFEIDMFGRLLLRQSPFPQFGDIFNLSITVYDGQYPTKVYNDYTFLTVMVERDLWSHQDEVLTWFVSEGAQVGSEVACIQHMPTMASTFFVDSWGNNNGEFVLDPVSGCLLLNKRVDREKLDMYNMVVAVKYLWKQATKRAAFNVTVVVLDEDDVESKISFPSTPITLSELSPVGTFVTVLNVTDHDIAHNSAVTCQIVSGNDDHQFVIDPLTSVITVQRRLDYEIKAAFWLNISCVDFNNKYHKKVGVVQVKVRDENDESPVFERGCEIRLAVTETFEGDERIFLDFVRAKDPEMGQFGEVSYILHQNEQNLFEMDPQTGALYLIAPIVHKQTPQITLKVQAIDHGPNQLESTATVTVIVIQSRNRKSYEFPSRIRVNVEENRVIQEAIALVQPTEFEVTGNPVVFSCLNDESVPFQVNSTTGEVRMTKALDFEEKSVWKLLIEAKEIGQFMTFSSEITVVVNVGERVLTQFNLQVIDENDNPPSFLNKDVDFYVPSTVNTTDIIYVLSAQDPDSTSQDQLKYQIDGDDALKFSVDQFGAIRPKETTLTKAKYTILATVSDESGQNSTVSVNFYTADPGKFPKEKNPAVHELHALENEKFEQVYDLSKYFDKAINSMTVDIISGTRKNLFNIDNENNMVVKPLDREEQAKYHIFLGFADEKTPSFVSFVQVELVVKDENDNAPEFEHDLYTVNVTENTLPTKPLIQLKATDRDAGENAHSSFAILTDTDGTFAIHPQTGDLVLRHALDRETVPTWRLSVECIDEGQPPMKSLTTVVVHVGDVNDNPPRFSKLLQETIAENAAVGSFVTKIEVEDPDVAGDESVTFEKEVGEQSDHFHLDPQDGVVTLARAIDREELDELKLKVIFRDEQWQISSILSVKVADVNDNAPVFETNTTTIHLSSPPKRGQVIGRISATDLDIGDSGKVHYHLKDGNDYVRIDVMTGDVIVVKKFDVFVDKLEVGVVAIDQGEVQQKSEDLLRIFVRSRAVDEIKVCGGVEVADMLHKSMKLIGGFRRKGNGPTTLPRFSNEKYNFKVSQKASNGTLVGPLVISGANTSRIALEPQPYFVIDQKGQNEIQLVTNPEKAIDFYAIFDFYRPDDKLEMARVHIAPKGEQVVPLLERVVNVSIPENSPPKTTVHDFNNKLPPNAAIAIVAGNVNHKSDYELEVALFLESAIVSRSKVVVHVVDLDDCAPKVRPGFQFFRIAENVVVDHMAVGRIVVDDCDALETSRKTAFDFVNSSVNDVFGIDRNTGAVFTKKALDREQKSLYKHDLYIKDGFGNTAQSSIYVIVDDVKDNALTNQQLKYTYVLPLAQRSAHVSRLLRELQPVSLDSRLNHVRCVEDFEEAYTVYTNCSVNFNRMSIGERTLKMSAGDGLEDVKYDVRLEVVEPFRALGKVVDVVSVGMVGEQSGVANVLRRMRDELKDNYSHNVILSVTNENGHPFSVLEMESILKGFFAKHVGSLNVYNVDVSSTMLCYPRCRVGSVCAAHVTESRSFYRDLDFALDAPVVDWRCDCTHHENCFGGSLNDAYDDIPTDEAKEVGGECVRNSCDTTVALHEHSEFSIETAEPTDRLSLTVATLESNGLLLYTYGEGRNYLALEMVNGFVVLHGWSGEAAEKILDGLRINDGKPYNISLTMTEKAIDLTACESSDCKECPNGTCRANLSSKVGWPLMKWHIGWAGNTQTLLQRPGQVASRTFQGCVRGIRVNGKGADDDSVTVVKKHTASLCDVRKHNEEVHTVVERPVISSLDLHIRLTPNELLNRTRSFVPRNAIAKVARMGHTKRSSLQDVIRNVRDVDTSSAEEPDAEDLPILEIEFRTLSRDLQLALVSYGKGQTLSVRAVNGTVRLTQGLHKQSDDSWETVDFGKWTNVRVSYSAIQHQYLISINGGKPSNVNVDSGRLPSIRNFDTVDIGAGNRTQGARADNSACLRLVKAFGHEVKLGLSLTDDDKIDQLFSLTYPSAKAVENCLRSTLCARIDRTKDVCPLDKVSTATLRNIALLVICCATLSSLFTVLLCLLQRRVGQKSMQKRNCQRVSNLKLITGTGGGLALEDKTYEQYGSVNFDESGETLPCYCDNFSSASSSHHQIYHNLYNFKPHNSSLSLSTFGQPAPKEYDVPVSSTPLSQTRKSVQSNPVTQSSNDQSPYAKPVSIIYSPRLEVGYVVGAEENVYDRMNDTMDTGVYHELDYGEVRKDINQEGYV